MLLVDAVAVAVDTTVDEGGEWYISTKPSGSGVPGPMRGVSVLLEPSLAEDRGHHRRAT